MSEIARSSGGSVFSRWWWMGLVSVIGFALVGCLFAAVTAYVMPKKFESKAVVQVQGSPGASAPEGTGIDVSKATILSKESRDKVVGSLRLGTKWSMADEAASEALLKMMDVQVIRGTDLVSIQVRHNNPEDARDIADALVTAFRELRFGHGEKMIVHEAPGIGHVPVSPNVPLILGTGVLGGILLGLIVAYPVMRIAEGRRRSAGPPPLG